MVTEERSVENESQVQTPTNYHQRIKIQNTKSKPRAGKIKSSSIRTTVANLNVLKQNFQRSFPRELVYRDYKALIRLHSKES